MTPEMTAFIGQLGFGGLLGYAAGYATQKALKLLLFLLGGLFIAVQVLAYYGFVDVHWGAIQAAAEPVLDQPQLTRYVNQFLDILKTNLPFAGGFTAGFLLGLRAR